MQHIGGEMNEAAARLEQQFAFILELDKLKQVLRQSYLTGKLRRENDAEHSWHLAMMALVLREYAAEPNINLQRVIAMVLVHDLVEIDAGDTFLYDAVGNMDKDAREQAAAERVFGLLPAEQCAELRGLWDEFEAGRTAEAHFARALDRVEPILLNVHTQGRTWREHQVTLEMALERNREPLMQGSPVLAEYMLRLIQDADARGDLSTIQLPDETITYRPLRPGDRQWLVLLLEEHWGGRTIVTRGKVHQAYTLPGFIALAGEQPVGVVLYHRDGISCELVLLHSLREGIGIGTTLLKQVWQAAQAAACRRLWLVTTNDNTPALGYYQKRGFQLVAIYKDALTVARELKPSIPLYGIERIPLRDEIEMEIGL